jgi:hypothetical protein
MTSPNLSEIVTTTLRNRSGALSDNVTENNALLRELKKQGNVKPFRGGRSIVQEIEYAENSTFKRYSGYEALNIQASDVFTAAEYDIKQYAVAVTMSGLEMIQNSGKEQVIDLLEARIKNAEKTMMNQLAADVYSAGTSDGGKQIGGLQALVADSPSSGTVGGINRASWSFWRNQTYDVSSEGTATTAQTIQANMNEAFLKVTRGQDKPTLIIADNSYFSLYWNSLQAIQRIQRTDRGALGFQELDFAGVPVIADGGYGGNAPTGSNLSSSRMYFLNTNYLFLRPYPERDMKPIGDDRFSTNQDAMVKLIGWAGNMTMSNAFLQLVFFE